MHLKPKPFHTLLIIIVLCCCSPRLLAQHADSATYKPNIIYYWAGWHFGGGSFNLMAGADAGMLIGNRFIVAGRADANGNFNIFAPPTETQEAEEYAFLMGIKLTHKRYSNLYLLSGVSAVRQVDRGDYLGTSSGFFYPTPDYGDNKVFHSIGIPIQLTYMLPPTSFFAMNFSGAVDVNPHRTFFTLSFGILFGHIRSGQPKGPPGAPDERPELPPKRKFFSWP